MVGKAQRQHQTIASRRLRTVPTKAQAGKNFRRSSPVTVDVVW